MMMRCWTRLQWRILWEYLSNILSAILLGYRKTNRLTDFSRSEFKESRRLEAIFWACLVDVRKIDTASPFAVLSLDDNRVGQPFGIFYFFNGPCFTSFLLDRLVCWIHVQFLRGYLWIDFNHVFNWPGKSGDILMKEFDDLGLHAYFEFGTNSDAPFWILRVNVDHNDLLPAWAGWSQYREIFRSSNLVIKFN